MSVTVVTVVASATSNDGSGELANSALAHGLDAAPRPKKEKKKGKKEKVSSSSKDKSTRKDEKTSEETTTIAIAGEDWHAPAESGIAVAASETKLKREKKKAKKAAIPEHLIDDSLDPVSMESKKKTAIPISPDPATSDAAQSAPIMLSSGVASVDEGKNDVLVETPSETPWFLLPQSSDDPLAPLFAKYAPRLKRKRPALDDVDPDIPNAPPFDSLVALDCEMITIKKKSPTWTPLNQTYIFEDTLARVSLVDADGVTLYDTFCKPEGTVVDFKTQYSGVTRELIKDAPKQKDVISEVRKLMKDRCVVGQSVEGDLAVLGLCDKETFRIDSLIAAVAKSGDENASALLSAHASWMLGRPFGETTGAGQEEPDWRFWPLERIRDTAYYFRRFHPKGFTPSLRNLARWNLGIDIQQGSHDSVIDARVSMLLYLQVRKVWESTYPVSDPCMFAYRLENFKPFPMPDGLPDPFKAAMMLFEETSIFRPAQSEDVEQKPKPPGLEDFPHLEDLLPNEHTVALPSIVDTPENLARLCSKTLATIFYPMLPDTAPLVRLAGPPEWLVPLDKRLEVRVLPPPPVSVKEALSMHKTDTSQPGVKKRRRLETEAEEVTKRTKADSEKGPTVTALSSSVTALETAVATVAGEAASSLAVESESLQATETETVVSKGKKKKRKAEAMCVDEAKPSTSVKDSVVSGEQRKRRKKDKE
ncbi:hypothetical protein DFJ73DRAFT_957251 [Zopfochytrium polystomum]|nr:hypothetical protein DFJ73DRAFT_957251 [Zopfochytrium polystomum]